MVCSLRKFITRFRCPWNLFRFAWMKRESGENPERSRHCVREYVFISLSLLGKRTHALIEVRRPAYFR